MITNYIWHRRRKIKTSQATFVTLLQIQLQRSGQIDRQTEQLPLRSTLQTKQKMKFTATTSA